MPEHVFASSSRDHHGRPTLTLRVVEHPDHTDLVARGEIDLDTAHLLSRCGTIAQRNHPQPLVLDLSAVTFFSAAGLRALLTLRRNANPHAPLRLLGASPTVRHVLDLVGLTDTFGGGAPEPRQPEPPERRNDAIPP